MRPIISARRISCWGVPGLPEVRPGDRLDQLGAAALRDAGGLEPWDVVVVTHKVVSKADGRITDLGTVDPGPRARELAAQLGQDPRMTQVILDEARAVVRAERGILVTETVQGLVCANSGVDRSNVGGGTAVVRLPLRPDESAQALRSAWLPLAGGGPLGVVISDTFGRPFREGAVNVAIGVAGMPAISDHRGLEDDQGYLLHASTIGSADEIAGLGEMVMGKIDSVPMAVVRGVRWVGPDQGAGALLRPAARDIFRR